MGWDVGFRYPVLGLRRGAREAEMQFTKKLTAKAVEKANRAGTQTAAGCT